MPKDNKPRDRHAINILVTSPEKKVIQEFSDYSGYSITTIIKLFIQALSPLIILMGEEKYQLLSVEEVYLALYTTLEEAIDFIEEKFQEKLEELRKIN